MSTRVVIVGGGAVGLEVALRFERSTAEVDLTIVDPTGLHVYQPLLPEVAAGTIEPRHAVIPLRAALRSATVLDGEAVGLDEERGVLTVCTRGGAEHELPFDHLVVAPGSVTRVMPIPGLAENAVGFQSIAEGLYMRDHLLERLQTAEGITDPMRRARALTFVVVGAGYSGVELVGELHDTATAATEQFGDLHPDELRFVLVEATDTILPMVNEPLREAAVEHLERQGIEVRLSTMVESVVDERIELSDGSHIESDTLVWCAGARPSGLAEELGLPTNDDGALLVDATLQVRGRRSIWAAGDAAEVPDLVKGGTCPGSAQYAVRQAHQLAANIERVARGEEPQDFRYHQRGELITLGHGFAVGYVGPIRLTGRTAWALRAGYHLARFPGGARRLRVGIDWAVNLLLPREITDLGTTRHPMRPMREAVEVARRAS